ncbi:MAG: hypothetical protein AAGA00_15770 [Pseudomonadota bacterium]
MTTIDFNSELARRIRRHALDRYGLELLQNEGDGYRLLDIALNRPDYPSDGSYTSLTRINAYLTERDKAHKGSGWRSPDDNSPA